MVQLLSQQASTVVLTSPGEKLKSKRMAGAGKGSVFSEKTKEPRTLSTEFPSSVTFNLNKVHALGDAWILL